MWMNCRPVISGPTTCIKASDGPTCWTFRTVPSFVRQPLLTIPPLFYANLPTSSSSIMKTTNAPIPFHLQPAFLPALQLSTLVKTHRWTATDRQIPPMNFVRPPIVATPSSNRPTIPPSYNRFANPWQATEALWSLPKWSDEWLNLVPWVLAIRPESHPPAPIWVPSIWCDWFTIPKRNLIFAILWNWMPTQIRSSRKNKDAAVGLLRVDSARPNQCIPCLRVTAKPKRLSKHR